MRVDDYRNITFSGAYDDGENLIVSSHVFNGMLRINKETAVAEYVCSFDNDATNMLLLHYKIFKYNGYLVFVPNNAKSVYLYNMDEEKMSYYPIDEKEAARTRCITYALNNNKLWLFYAFAEHPVVIFDLDTKTVEYWDGIINKLPEEISKRKKMAVFWNAFAQNGAKVYGVIWKSPYVVEIDMNSKKVLIHKMLQEDLQLTAIACDGDTLWLVESRNKLILKWNKKQGVIGRFQADEKYLVSQSVYCNAICYDSKLIVLFDDCKEVFFINEEQKSMEVLCSFPEKFESFEGVRTQWRRFYNYDVIGDVIRVYPTNANMLLDINVRESKIEAHQFILDEKYDEKWYQKNIMNPYIEASYSDGKLVESKDISLEDYLKYILSEG